jgi:hypothetical protein
MVLDMTAPLITLRLESLACVHAVESEKAFGQLCLKFQQVRPCRQKRMIKDYCFETTYMQGQATLGLPIDGPKCHVQRIQQHLA